MKKNKIRNITSLENEIYRLKLEAINKEKQLADNITYLEKHAPKLIANSLLCKNEEGEKKNGSEGFFKNSVFNSIISKITDRITDRAGDGIDSLLDKIFHRRKHEA